MKNSLLACALVLSAGVVAAQTGSTRPFILGRGNWQEPNRGFPITPFASLTGTYIRGFRPAALEGENIPELNRYGASVSLGAGGSHAWKRSVLNLGYLSRYRDYSENPSPTGFEHSLSIGFAHQLSQRVSFSLSQVGGISRVGFASGLSGVFTPIGIGSFAFNPTMSMVPTEDYIDTKTYYAASGGDITFQKGPRLSFNAGATGFWVRRPTEGLAGTIGASARGDIGYQISRRSAVFIDYSFTQFSLTRYFSESTIHGVGVGYATALNRQWAFSVRGGVYQLESNRTQRVTLSPLIASLLGERFGFEQFHGLIYGTQGDVSLFGAFRWSDLGLNYRRGVIPGNGIYLTSQRDIGSLSYGINRFRNWGLGFNATIVRLSTRIQTARTSMSYRTGATASRRLFSFVHATAAFDYGRYKSGDYQRDYVSARVGLGFWPGQLPLTFW